jgi:hypothetical protein
MVVVDGAEGKAYDGILKSSLAFSPDSRRIAYGAKIGEKWTVVVDGVERGNFDGVASGSVSFSSDSGQVATKSRSVRIGRL